MLHQQADGGDAHPAAGTQQQGLAAAFHQLDEIAVQPDGRHGHDNEELAQLLQGPEHGSGHAEGCAEGGDHRCAEEPQNEQGKGVF